LDQALITFLRATTAITALVGNEINWGNRPQASALPAITLTLVSRIPVDSDEGDSGLFFARVQIDCWAATMTAAKALAVEVRKALSGKRVEQTLALFEGVWTENETDFAGDGFASTTIQRVSLDLTFNYHEHL